MGWFIGAVTVIALVGGAYAWESLKQKDSTAGSAARTASAAAGATGRFIVRLYAIGLALIGVAVIVLSKGDAGALMAGLALVAYGVYLLFGGRWVIY